MVVGAACSSSNRASQSSRTSRASTPSTTRASTTTSPAPSPTTSQPDLAAARVRLNEVASGLDSPVAIAWRGSDRRPYFAEQGGRIRIIINGRPAAQPVLSIAVSGGNEQGLLDLAFSRDGSHLYVDYTDPNGDTHVDEYAMHGDVADRSTRRQVLFQRQPFSNHNGGEVIFGPDGMLYVGLGDGGSEGDPQGNGQNLGTWLGKILRINPTSSAGRSYTVPPDNPFVGRAGARPEIWMYGLRNPWRFSFDRATHDVWIGDVGQNTYEEVDYARAGEASINWGWNAREGFHAFAGARPSGARDPILETTHAAGNCSVTGGYVYRGRAVPALAGAYVFGDFCRGQLVGVTQRGGRLVMQRELGLDVPMLTTFGEDQGGELYAVSREGRVYRLTAR